MKTSRREKNRGQVRIYPALAGLALAMSFGTSPSAMAGGGGTPFPSQGDDTTFSLGQFRIAVDAKFQPFLSGAPGYDSTTHRLTSPLLFDPSTKIGRSNPIIAGSADDLLGTPVGSAGTIVKDSDHTLVPVGFENAGDTTSREVHTQIIDFNLGRGSGGLAVRAGLSAPDRPASVGEVESLSTSGKPDKDFSARSFFDVFVDVDLPGFGTLYNKAPLLIENDLITGFPPTVVYIHGGTSAIPLLFSANDPNGHWLKDDRFGYLVLAGHGVGFAPAGHGHGGEPGEVEFETELNRHGELPIPVPEPSSALLLGIGLAAVGLAYGRKRSQQA